MAELQETLANLAAKARRLLATSEEVGEQNTKAVLVEPMLEALGWDTRDLDEVRHEFRRNPQDNPVDYALFVAGHPRLFVEAKSLGRDLGRRKWRIQTVSYASVAGVDWCVLTDGNFWQVYKSSSPEDLDQKLFLETWLYSPENRTPPFSPHYVLSLLARDKLAENDLATLWQVLNVDRRGREAVRAMLDERDASLVRLLRKRAGLTQKEVEAFLNRAEVSVETPAAAVRPELPKQEPEKPARPKRQHRGMPSQTTLEVPLLRALVARGGEVVIKHYRAEIEEALAREFGLTDMQRSAVFSDGKTTVWGNRIAWAKLRLVQSGDLDGSQRGIWRVTEQGRGRAQESQKLE